MLLDTNWWMDGWLLLRSRDLAFLRCVISIAHLSKIGERFSTKAGIFQLSGGNESVSPEILCSRGGTGFD